MLITPEYSEQNRLLHETNEFYGISGHKHVNAVLDILKEYNAESLLDYGCGKATLARAIAERSEELNEHVVIENYDPAIEKYSKRPTPCDVVVCGDVLEHIEPDCLDDVLADLRSLTVNAAYFVIALQPAKKFLSDGRNAHLLVKPPEWWIEKLERNWKIWKTEQTQQNLKLTLSPR